jgi:hypothetical protein
MKIRKESQTFKIFSTIQQILKEGKEHISTLSFNALISRKTLGQTMSALGGYSPKEPYSKEGFHMALRKLKRRELIRFTDNDQFTLTEKGRGILLKFEIDDIKLPDFSLQNWDGNWRVLIFDVPEISRAARDILRSKIQELGFYTLQKSVYVTPRPCEKEIIGLARMLKISGGVHVLEVKKLGRNETRIRRFFGVD